MRIRLPHLGLLLALAPLVALADRFDATDYECDLLARESLGARCGVWRLPYPDGTVLLTWVDEDRPQDEASKKRRAYRLQTIRENYIARGGRSENRRSTHEGAPVSRSCSLPKGKASMWCAPWEKDGVAPPGQEWAVIMGESRS